MKHPQPGILEELSEVSAVKKRGRPKGRKNSRPAPKPARVAEAVIDEVIAHASKLEISVRVMIDRAFRAEPEPHIHPEELLKRYMLKSERVFLWAMEHLYGKPKQFLEATGAAGGPMELNVVIERIGEKK